MDAFGDDFTAAAEVDPAAEFLAREQDQLAGLEDELLNGVQPHEIAAQPVQGKILGLITIVIGLLHDIIDALIIFCGDFVAYRWFLD